MAETQTVARPYAEAIFTLARGQGSLPQWSETLELLALVAADAAMGPVLASPRPAPAELEQLFFDICGEHLDPTARNLVRLLAENRRLAALPAVRQQFEALRAEEEGTLEAQLISAQPVADDVRDQLATALGTRLNRRVSLQTEVDPALLGGAMIRAGDMVIDGSVRGRLESLSAQLNR